MEKRKTPMAYLSGDVTMNRENDIQSGKRIEYGCEPIQKVKSTVHLVRGLSAVKLADLMLRRRFNSDEGLCIASWESELTGTLVLTQWFLSTSGGSMRCQEFYMGWRFKPVYSQIFRPWSICNDQS